ncbi:hypothetical protein cypCar_00048050, partial [Cyprinus carpio]
CCFILVFSVILINKVSLQVTVEAVIGGSVLLPCSSVKHDLELKDINVHWRHTNGKIVHDIVQGEDSVAEQDPEYKNRVKTFPEEYQRGNFSLKLNNLQDTDAGEFKCLITPSDEQKTVQMIIKAPVLSQSSCLYKPCPFSSVLSGLPVPYVCLPPILPDGPRANFASFVEWKLARNGSPFPTCSQGLIASATPNPEPSPPSLHGMEHKPEPTNDREAEPNLSDQVQEPATVPTARSCGRCERGVEWSPLHHG